MWRWCWSILVFPTSPLCNGVIIQDQRSTLWLWELCAGSEECRCASGEDTVCLQTKIAGGLRCKYSPSSSSPLTVRRWPLTSPSRMRPMRDSWWLALHDVRSSLRWDWRPGSRASGVALGLRAAGQRLVFLKALWRELRSQGASIREAWVWRLLWIRLISQMHILSRGKHRWKCQVRCFQKRLTSEFLDILLHKKQYRCILRFYINDSL